jgi:hypothetical protein
MDKMRVILKGLMDRAGHNAYDIQKECGVNQSTTFRFITGLSGEPRPSTVRKWARLYNLTESQLRGDMPIDGIQLPPEKQELKNLVTPSEYRLLANMKKLDGEARGILHRLTEMLADAPKTGQNGAIDDPVGKNEPNNQLRVGEVRYRSPPKKSRIKVNIDATKRTGTS